MPNESSGKDLQITCWSLLRQISPSWRNLRHKMSTSVKLFLFILLLSFFLSPGHDLFTVSKQLAIRFQRNFACILMGSVRIAVQNFIDLVFDLDLSRSQMCKITFWAIPRFLLDKSSPNFNTGWLGSGTFNKSKNILSGLNVRRTRTRYVGRHYAK